MELGLGVTFRHVSNFSKILYLTKIFSLFSPSVGWGGKHPQNYFNVICEWPLKALFIPIQINSCILVGAKS